MKVGICQNVTGKRACELEESPSLAQGKELDGDLWPPVSCSLNGVRSQADCIQTQNYTTLGVGFLSTGVVPGLLVSPRPSTRFPFEPRRRCTEAISIP